MAFTVVGADGVMQLTMSFISTNGSWDEKLYLTQTDYTAAKAAALPLVAARRNVLPDTMQLRRAHINIVGGIRDSKLVNLAYPLIGLFRGVGTTFTPGPPPVTTYTDPGTHTVNRVEDAVIIRYESDKGDWSQRYMHGVPDDEIEGDRLTGTFAEFIPPAAAPAHASPETVEWLDWLAYYMYLCKQTLMYSPGDGIAKQPRTSPVDVISILKVGRHKVGEGSARLRGRAIPR